MTTWEYDIDREPTYQEFKAWLYEHLGYVSSIDIIPQPYGARKSCGVFEQYLKEFEKDFEERQRRKEAKKRCREIFNSKEVRDFDTMFDVIYDELNKARY